MAFFLYIWIDYKAYLGDWLRQASKLGRAIESIIKSMTIGTRVLK